MGLELLRFVSERTEGSGAEGETLPRGVFSPAGRPGLLDHLRVLIVDDDRGTREAEAGIFRYAGAQVRLATSAGEAMVAVEEFRPEVLLGDLAMPEEDGYSLKRRIRTLDIARGRRRHSGDSTDCRHRS